jgi:hypothetical protein
MRPTSAAAVVILHVKSGHIPKATLINNLYYFYFSGGGNNKRLFKSMDMNQLPVAYALNSSKCSSFPGPGLNNFVR